jgi:hypothetical protein
MSTVPGKHVMGGIGSTWGRRLWIGYLSSLGYRVRDRTVRSLLFELNPHGNAVRLQRQLVRRVYRVREPNALWHVDGNHKLKPWGFFIHGAIGVGTHFLLYLYLSTRNTSTTTLSPYRTACAKHQGCSLCAYRCWYRELWYRQLPAVGARVQPGWCVGWGFGAQSTYSANLA